jgi:farnesyl-diphosphate farnesyltransferase
MMISYLVYRVIDTIEDSSAPLVRKKEMFADFLSLLSARKQNAAKASECSRELLSSLNYTYEKELLEALPELVNAYRSLPSGAKSRILKWGHVMARGMYEFQLKPIETLEDQNRYSYYVAGVIGNLFNDLLHFNAIIGVRLKRKLSKFAREFGIALQKVNILRDIAEDISANRHYWPKKLLEKYGLTYSNICSRENREKALAVLREQVADARKYIDAAMQYILLLPKKALRVRMVCLIPLFMAIESYVKCMDNAELFESGKKVKITREQVSEIVAKSGMWGANNERLVGWFAASMRAVPGGAIADFAVARR